MPRVWALLDLPEAGKPAAGWGRGGWGRPTSLKARFRTIQVCPKDFTAAPRDTAATVFNSEKRFEPKGERTWILAGLVRIQETTRACSTSPRHCPRWASCTAPLTSIRWMRRSPRATSKHPAAAALSLPCPATPSGSPDRGACGESPLPAASVAPPARVPAMLTRAGSSASHETPRLHQHFRRRGGRAFASLVARGARAAERADAGDRAPRCDIVRE